MSYYEIRSKVSGQVLLKATTDNLERSIANHKMLAYHRMHPIPEVMYDITRFGTSDLDFWTPTPVAIERINEVIKEVKEVKRKKKSG